MTKIKEFNNKTDVHLHIDKAYKIIEGKLPPEYVEKVFQKITNDRSLTSSIIRNIKNRTTTYPQSRVNVINALVEIANEYQADLENLKELTK